MSARRVALVTAAATAAACPAVITLLRRRGILDSPNHRSSHTQPTPRGGGFACAVGAVAGTAAAQVGGSIVPWPVLGGVATLASLGGIDDVRGLDAAPRLAVQVAAGGTMGAFALGGLRGVVAGAALTPLLVNVTNFMDGINGISGATAVVWGTNAVLVGRRNASSDVCVLGSLALGAGAGFLPFNLPTARLFLGDVGSYLLGGLYSAGALLAIRDGEFVAVMAPLAPYLADTLSTLARRAARGEKLTEAHREHLYQTLVSDRGWSHTQVTAAAAVAAAAVALFASGCPAATP